VSLSFGLVAATALTLIFVPALYVVIREWSLFLIGGQEVEDVQRDGAQSKLDNDL